MDQILKTIGALSREIAVPEWKVRRVADSLGETVPRAGLYRLVPPDVEQRIRGELARTGWLDKAPEAAPCS